MAPSLSCSHCGRAAERAAWQLLDAADQPRHGVGPRLAAGLEPPSSPTGLAAARRPVVLQAAVLAQIVDFLMQEDEAEGGSPWCAALSYGGLRTCSACCARGRLARHDLLDPTRGSQALPRAAAARACQFLLREPRAPLPCSPLEPLDLAGATAVSPPEPQPQRAKEGAEPVWAHRSFSCSVARWRTRCARCSLSCSCWRSSSASPARRCPLRPADQTPTEGAKRPSTYKCARCCSCGGLPRSESAALPSSSAASAALLAACMQLDGGPSEIAAGALPSARTSRRDAPPQRRGRRACGELHRAHRLARDVPRSASTVGPTARCRQYFELFQPCSRPRRHRQARRAAGRSSRASSPLVREHAMRERRDRPELIDQVLLGYMSLLLALVRARPGQGIPRAARRPRPRRDALRQPLLLAVAVGRAGRARRGPSASRPSAARPRSTCSSCRRRRDNLSALTR